MDGGKKNRYDSLKFISLKKINKCM